MRVLTWNLNRCSGGGGGCRTESQVLAFLQKHADSIDVACLQLCPSDLVQAATKALGVGFHAAAFTPRDFQESGDCGVAIVSRLKSCDPELGASHVCATLEEGDVCVKIACAHLDNTSEAKRIQQVAEIITAHAPDVIAGDLNALCRTDYGEEGWKALEDLANRKGWEPRMEACTRLVAASGYQDVASSSEPKPFEATFVLRLPDEDPTPLRLDYVYVRGSADIGVCRVFAEAGGASNHFPMLSDVRIEK